MTNRVFLFKKPALALLLWAVLCHAVTCAAADFRTLVVTKNDGSKLQFALTSKLKLSFSEDFLQVRDEAVNVDVPRDELSAFRVSEEESGIAQARADVGVSAPTMTNAGVVFGNLSEPATVKLFSADGKLLKTCEVNEGTLLPYSDFVSGINIMDVGGVPFKIYVK